LNEHLKDFREDTINHNLQVRGINPYKLTNKDYRSIKSKKVTCDMCKKLFDYKKLTRVTNIGMICDSCYFK